MSIIVRKKGRPPISVDTKNKVLELYNEDEITCNEIAKECNISRASVFRIISELRKLDEEIYKVLNEEECADGEE